MADRQNQFFYNSLRRKMPLTAGSTEGVEIFQMNLCGYLRARRKMKIVSRYSPLFQTMFPILFLSNAAGGIQLTTDIVIHNFPGRRSDL